MKELKMYAMEAIHKHRNYRLFCYSFSILFDIKGYSVTAANFHSSHSSVPNFNENKTKRAHLVIQICKIDSFT